MHCASIHRKIGTHISKVYVAILQAVSTMGLTLQFSKSVTMDTWTKEQTEVCPLLHPVHLHIMVYTEVEHEGDRKPEIECDIQS